MLAVLSIFFLWKKGVTFFMALSLADLLEEGSDGGGRVAVIYINTCREGFVLFLGLICN